MHPDIVPVGRISGVYGVRGWVRVFSYTQPRENIINYQPWYLKQGDDWIERRLAEGRQHGKGVVARFADCEDRDKAAAMIGAEIGIQRSQMPRPEPGQYYWADLIGLRVTNLDGDELGVVDHLIETGANDVLVVHGDRERLIPFVLEQVVVSVNLEQGEIQLDWDKDF